MSESEGIATALALLSPCSVPSLPKVRIGNPLGDGGYVMADRFRPGQVAYSFGIADDVSFDLALAERGLQLFMYDHTISRLPLSHPGFHFFKRGIAEIDLPNQLLSALRPELLRNRHKDRDMILKIDVEGAEWAVFDSLAASLLGRFEQIVIELHELSRVAEPAFRARFVRIFEKLRKAFNIIHVHANNCVPLGSVDGGPMPNVLEVSLLRKDLGAAGDWETVIPSELDAPNATDRPDYVLSYPPFRPTALPADELARLVEEAGRRAHMPFVERGRAAGQRVKSRGLDIALQGICSQSSLSALSKGPDEANRALAATRERDGGYAFHTDNQVNAWWQVDLGAVRQLDEIVCFNRLDAWSKRANHLIVELSNTGSDWRVLHQNDGPFGGVDGRPLRVCSPRQSARYVRLRTPTVNPLHLDGVEVLDWEH